MTRDLQVINSSGELTEIKLGGTTSGYALLTADEIAIQTAISSVPYTGATNDVDLGNYTIDVKRILQNYNGESIFIGKDAGLNDDLSSNENVFIGSQTGVTNTSGERNTANGHKSLFSNTLGGYNTSYGHRSLYSNSIGDYNTAIGAQSLYYNTDSNNTAIGAQSLLNHITGTGNIAHGYAAGCYISGGADKTTGDYGVYLGSYTKAYSDGTTNEIVIGANAIGNGSNTATIGDGNITDLYAGENGQAKVHAGRLNISNIPTSDSGLVSGDIWSNGGILTIVS